MGQNASPRNFPAELSSSPALGVGRLATAVTNAIGSAGMMLILWLSLGAFVWAVLRVLTLFSLARRRRATGF